MKCEICDLVFEGRPNRRYCSLKCRRKAEMAERKRKRQARYEAWRASWTPAEREFWESMSELKIDWTPEDQKAWDEWIASLPTLEEVMAINRPIMAKKENIK